MCVCVERERERERSPLCMFGKRGSRLTVPRFAETERGASWDCIVISCCTLKAGCCRYDRFIEVAATHYSHVSAAMTQTGKILMWGQCRGQSITAPIPTRFSCIDDVFAAFSAPPVTWRVYCIGQSVDGCTGQSVSLRMGV